MSEMDDFEIEIRQTFLDEAAQNLEDAEACYLGLQENVLEKDKIDTLFRLAHNLKGSSKAVGFLVIAEFTHELESFLLKVKKEELSLSQKVINLLIKSNDIVKALIENYRAGNLEYNIDPSHALELKNFTQDSPSNVPPVQENPLPEGIISEKETTPNDFSEIKTLPSEFSGSFEDFSTEIPQGTFVDFNPSETKASTQNHLESTQQEVVPQQILPDLKDQVSNEIKVEPILDQASIKISEEQPKIKASEVHKDEIAIKIPEVLKDEAAAKKAIELSEETIRISVKRIDKLQNLIGELVISETLLKEQMGDVMPNFRKSIQYLEKITKDIQDVSLSLRMVPIKSTFQKMQRIVRDTSQSLNKKVNLHLEGEETEIDKTILEKISDPLVHMIRNSVDHGVESSEDRIKFGKAVEGNIWLKAYHRSGYLVVDVQDDGQGLNPEKLIKKAIENKLITPNQNLSKQDIFQLIFLPGFSTKEVVTEVSGRGVGMDVVKRNIQQVQGSVNIESEVGKGSVFSIKIPLTLAIIDAMIVKSGEDKFVVPLVHVHETVQVKPQFLKQTSSLGEVLLLRGENLPSFRLSQLLKKKNTVLSDSIEVALIIRHESLSFAIIVDDILNQQSVVVKPLGPELNQIKGFSGSVILGDGKPSLILEPSDLVYQRAS